MYLERVKMIILVYGVVLVWIVAFAGLAIVPLVIEDVQGKSRRKRRALWLKV